LISEAKKIKAINSGVIVKNGNLVYFSRFTCWCKERDFINKVYFKEFFDFIQKLLASNKCDFAIF